MGHWGIASGQWGMGIGVLGIGVLGIGVLGNGTLGYWGIGPAAYLQRDEHALQLGPQRGLQLRSELGAQLGLRRMDRSLLRCELHLVRVRARVRVAIRVGVRVRVGVGSVLGLGSGLRARARGCSAASATCAASTRRSSLPCSTSISVAATPVALGDSRP